MDNTYIYIYISYIYIYIYCSLLPAVRLFAEAEEDPDEQEEVPLGTVHSAGPVGRFHIA